MNTPKPRPEDSENETLGGELLEGSGFENEVPLDEDATDQEPDGVPGRQ